MPGRNQATEEQRQKRATRLAENAARQKAAVCNLPAFGPACSRLCVTRKCPAGGGIDTCVSTNKQH